MGRLTEIWAEDKNEEGIDSRRAYISTGTVKALDMLNDIHPNYGKCVAMGCKDGEAYRMFVKNGVISLIPYENLSRICGD